MPTRVHALPDLAACSPTAAYEALLVQMTSWAVRWGCQRQFDTRTTTKIYRKIFWARTIKLVG